ncbi:putative adhesin [Kineococcus xinjiangensis]|uniref:Putative adhesin n=1 Tax=Kineococcus xinjiangensis TaxID=512762 RepID=A0A2S6IFX6_9ACTN|nr:DUF4097 family beta strand repeat-containing protein [Kineococcus xinjiangensis]PPK93122.1 putative adhesin [Kineococcus xinjiangensis]
MSTDTGRIGTQGAFAVPVEELPPPRPRRGGRAVAAVLGAVVVGGVALSAFGTMASTSSTTTREFPGAVTSLVVVTDTGEVRVREVPGRSGAQVVTTLSGYRSGPSADAGLTSGTLSLTGGCEGSAWPFPCSVSFDVEVPPGTDVDVASHTGDVDLAGTFPEVRAALRTGDLVWRDAAGESVEGRTSTGDVEVHGAVGEVLLATSTGAVRAELTEAPRSVAVESSTGDVTVVVPRDGARYDASTTTSTGDSTVQVPVDSTSDRRLRAETSTGDVVLRHP